MTQDTDDSPARVLLLTQAMQVMAARHKALERIPHPEDLMRLLRRVGADDTMCALASAAWSLLPDERDARALYLAFCVLGDDDIRKSMGPLPQDASVKITDAVRRVCARMHTPEGLGDATLHEQLLRGLAMHLELGVDEEREATSSYLFNNSDGTLTMMAARKKDYDSKLQRAKMAIDTRHRPARPHGE